MFAHLWQRRETYMETERVNGGRRTRGEQSRERERECFITPYYNQEDKTGRKKF